MITEINNIDWKNSSISKLNGCFYLSIVTPIVKIMRRGRRKKY
ncbi:MAG TPA: hypothetical protein PLE40_02575 [Candidatus Pacearchaeota archaeon]|nr:hypothetical protein [Candidatus Pacearchaeota archaeon]